MASKISGIKSIFNPRVRLTMADSALLFVFIFIACWWILPGTGRRGESAQGTARPRPSIFFVQGESKPLDSRKWPAGLEDVHFNNAADVKGLLKTSAVSTTSAFYAAVESLGTSDKIRPKSGRKGQISLRRRSLRVHLGLLLDSTMDAVTKVVTKRTNARNLEASQKIEVHADRSPQVIAHEPSDYRDIKKVEYNQPPSGVPQEKISKRPPWKQLEDKIEPSKLYHYQQDVDPDRVILTHDNQEKWKSKEAYLAEDKTWAAVLDANPSQEFLALFRLYNFLIKRSLSKQEIWWTKEQYHELLREGDFDLVHLTIRIGDLMQLDRPEQAALLSPIDQVELGRRFVSLFEEFKQSEKSYAKKWSSGKGKIWLNRNFIQLGDHQTRYQIFIRSLVSPLERAARPWRSLVEGSIKTKPKGWALLSMRIIWLDLGFDVEEMEELLYVLEAYTPPNIKKACQEAAQASQARSFRPIQRLPLAYSDQMAERIVRLFEFLAEEPKKRRLMLRWISENVFPAREVDESLLNIGKFAGNTKYDRLRFSILLCIHNVHYCLLEGFQALREWFRTVLNRCIPRFRRG